MSKLLGTALALGVSLLAAHPSRAGEMVNGGKLLLTGGVTTIEGSGGGGLATWATITGYETPEGVGANVHATYVKTPDYEFRAYGGSIGFHDRFELSYTRQEFDTGDTGALLGLGKGFTFGQDVYGAKVRVIGDALYDQDRMLPQISVGLQYKRADQGAIIAAIGGQDDSGTDYYVAATKVLLDKSLLLNGTVRMTKANQTGLLGFGGNKDDGYSAQFEGSVGYLLSKRLLVGAEYRSKPDNLNGLKEDDWFDLYAAYAINKNVSVTVGYADLGEIATFNGQHGLYLSLQAGF